MLRIITEHRCGTYRLELHGSITGDWIAVVERHWRGILEAAPSAIVIVGLSNVVFIDADGEQLLRRMAQRGVAFEGVGCMNRYVIEKVSGDEDQVSEVLLHAALRANMETLVVGCHRTQIAPRPSISIFAPASSSAFTSTSVIAG
jgi:hypothetical protein